MLKFSRKSERIVVSYYSVVVVDKNNVVSYAEILSPE